MLNIDLMFSLLDSLKEPFLFVDTEHIIRYMNSAALQHYEKGAALLGTNVLDCHNQDSNKIILEVHAAMQDGLEERLISEDEKQRIYMRAVRDKAGKLLGYYERYEPLEKNDKE